MSLVFSEAAHNKKLTAPFAPAGMRVTLIDSRQIVGRCGLDGTHFTQTSQACRAEVYSFNSERCYYN